MDFSAEMVPDPWAGFPVGVAEPSCIILGAAPASWMFMPKSIMLTRTWTWPWGCMSPPMTPKQKCGGVIFGDEGGDDGVEWAFFGGKTVGVVGIEGEEVAAILQGEAEGPGDESGAETAVDGLDEGDAVAVFVDDGEVDGVGVFELWVAVGEVFDGAIHFDKFAAFVSVGF